MLQFTNGRTLIVRLTKDLRKGAEVFNCYGPHVRRMNRERRHEILRDQYFFTCDCTACDRELEDGFSFVVSYNSHIYNKMQTYLYLNIFSLLLISVYYEFCIYFQDKFSALKCSKCSGPVIPDLAKQTFLVECKDCGAFENVEQHLHNSLKIGQMIASGICYY